MNLQDLKNNREEIINHINSRGYNLKFAMELAVEMCGICNSVDELLIEIDQYCRPVKEGSRLAELRYFAHEGEEYNVITKDWEKKKY